MSNESSALAYRIREVFLNGSWIANTNYNAQLSSITWQQAVQQTGNANTIAALTQHVNYYVEGLLHAFTHNKLTISDKYSFDFPPVVSEVDWKNRVEAFLHHAEKLAACVANMPESQLHDIFFDPNYGTVQRNIDALIEHSYYHLGQIVLLHKLILREA